ncbi:universal stress protein [Mycetocola spongiae]|uniref:universal stress protein n=1 Tax=Mycetocola spongiae TaxID=2859226 RepID=UPI001CF1A461|nr:universal stress protein [Mycetocola spongiae]UCR87951.1 universal stress protein [Mycetocola spongiae]
MHYIVGYTDTPSGRDALALAARLALPNDAIVEVVMVLDREERNQLVPPSPGYNRHLHQLAEGWLAEAAASLPAEVRSATHVIYADSFAEGLTLAAEELSASLIIVGAGGGGILGRFTVGSVANALLHSSVIPVALAPSGTGDLPMTTRLSRVTCAVGLRPGADRLLEAAVILSRAAQVPLRLLSVVALDSPGGTEDTEARERASAHAAQVQERSRALLPEDIAVHAEVVHGKRIEDAVLTVDWDPAEIVLVGSSRLARPAHLFLGSTASKMLRELPVPMVVVPRDSVLTLGGRS